MVSVFLACIWAGTHHRAGMLFTGKFQKSFVPPWRELNHEGNRYCGYFSV